jgi:Thiol-disulfide isomerase and thioredoxins
MVPGDELHDFHEHTKVRRLVWVIVGAVIALSIGIVVLRPADEKRGPGDVAPSMSLELLGVEGVEGVEGTLSDADLRGKPVVLNLWASWCIPCRREAKVFEAAHQKYGDRIQFVGVNVTDTLGAARDFVQEFGVTYPNVFDKGHRFADELGYAGLPQTYFLDADWHFVEASDQAPGELDRAGLEAGIEALLGGG